MKENQLSDVTMEDFVDDKIILGRALYDFRAREDDELSVKKGNQFVVLDKFDDGWWLVDCNHHQGLVPSNYIYELNSNNNQEEEEDLGYKGKYGL
jgi:hypothetical protein